MGRETPIRQAVMAKGYTWFTQPYQLNLIGIRNNEAKPNKFDDRFCICYTNGKEWYTHIFKCTTDPGLYYLLNPENVKGTAILVPDQYIDCWEIGKHKGLYNALRQCKPVTVWRDNDRDSLLDFGVAATETRLIYINIHRANEKWESVQVDRWSAGCQVIANPKSFDVLMKLAWEWVRLGGQYFSYTLLTEADLVSPIV